MALKTEDTREHILNVALELFIKRGYKSVTMLDLERATGLTKGAFYHYFKDKVEIFEAAVKRIIRVFALHINPEVEEKLSLVDFIEIYLTHLNKTTYYIHSMVGDDVLDNQLGGLIGDIHTYIPDFLVSISNLTKEDTERWNKLIIRAQTNLEIQSSMDARTIANLFLNIPDSIKRNRLLGTSIRNSLNEACLQYEQLYALLKVS